LKKQVLRQLKIASQAINIKVRATSGGDEFASD